MTPDARVLLVDENDDFLDGLSAWISDCLGFEVVGVAHSAGDAFERIETLSPDIVLMSLSLPNLNGLEATRRIKSRPGAPIVIVMSFHEIAAVRAEALSAGADACLTKPEIARDFLDVAGRLWRTRWRIVTEETPHPSPRRTIP